MLCNDMKLDGNKLKQRRLQKGWTLANVARRTGRGGERLSLVTVKNAEDGESLYPGNALKICKALGLLDESGMIPTGLIVSIENEGDGDAA